MTLNLHKMSVLCYIVNSQYMAKFSFFFVFICGVATAAFVYALLAICRPSVKAILTPYALLPSTQQLVFEELAFGIIDIRPDVDHDLILKPSHALLSAKKNRESENSSAQAEALASLHMALEMKSFGKLDKAVKLFQHALALHPTHPDILNQYGEFLEEKQNDIIKAEHMYTRALTLSPGHSRALSNRKRTLPQVQILDRMLLARIDAKRDQLGQIPEQNSALRRVKKEAYFQHIYHTVAIEGNTMTLSQTRHIVETGMTVAGKSIMEHNEILGLDAALSYINSSLVHRIGAITVDDILEIHKRVLGFVDPVEGGTFRRTQVFVGDHVPPHPSDVRLLMEDFVQWLNSDAALQMHPVKYAALAHYKLVFIHPFTDGNGRTARLLMNLILMQAGFPPVIIRKQDRQHYYDYLETANEGDVRPFIRFIADCTEKTLEVYLFAIKEYPSRDIPALDSVNKMKTIIIEE